MIEGKYNFVINIVPRKPEIFTKSLKQLVETRKSQLNASWALDWSSQEEHRADALALGADEGRDKLR